jgi:hypothetical protein
MIKQFVQKNVTLVAIIIFMTIFISTQITKPSIFYNLDGSIRLFGVGYQNKTIMPIWLLSIFIGILSYTMVLGYATYF